MVYHLWDQITKRLWPATRGLSYSLALREASHNVVSCATTRNWGCPLANSQQATEALSPTTCKNLNPANTRVSLAVAPSQLSLQVRLQLQRTPRLEPQESPGGTHLCSSRFLTHRNQETTNVSGFKVLSLGQLVIKQMITKRASKFERPSPGIL